MLKNTRFFILFLASLISCAVLNSIPVFAQNVSATERLSGNDRYSTCIAISQSGWTQATTVIIASGLDFPDALSASALSKSKDAPILLTKKAALDPLTLAELTRLKATQALIIGGTGVISTGVEQQLTTLGIAFTRISGTDRYDTSKKVAELVGTNNGIIVASGLDFPDALSIAPIASIQGIPILLSPKNSLDPIMTAFLKGKTIPASYLVGGISVLSPAVASSISGNNRLSGADRYATNLNINNQFTSDLNFDTVYLASGNDFPDALGGAALAAKNNAPIILTDKNSISKATIDFIKSKNVKHVVILGAIGAVSQSVENIIITTVNSLVIHPSSVSLNKTSISLMAGDVDTLTPTITPDNAVTKTIIWKSSSNSIATVDSTGNITAVKVGTAIITATTTDGSKIATCTVIVTEPIVTVISVGLNKPTDALTISGSAILTEGSSDTLIATIIPSNSTNKGLIWVSSNTSIVTVDNTGKLTAITTGNSLITVITSDGSKIATCSVTVSIAPVTQVTTVSLSKTADAIIIGGTDILISTASPSTANKTVTWLTSNFMIAAVDPTGKVTGIGEGTATITATTIDGAKVATCIITVTKRPPIKIAIDPGHGGYDSGAVGPKGILEKNVNLAIALKVGQILQQNGIDIVYTRTSDDVSWPSVEGQDLQVRCDIANAAKVDYYVCIHANSFGNPSANGVETYYSGGSDAGQALAQSIQDELVKADGLDDRGIKTANFYVLRNTDAPAILTEVAFISNPTEESLLNSSAFQEKSAMAIANGILKIVN